jgi:hypothetical protein
MEATNYVIDCENSPLDREKALELLDSIGFVVFRNFLPQEAVEYAVKEVDNYSKHPAVAGVPGYNKVDYPKKVFSPFIIGGPVVDLLLNTEVIDVIEAYMESDCILAETFIKIDEGVGYEYFPLHSDFAIGWTKSATNESAPTVTAEQLKDPLGVGGMICLHDTTEGAFFYSAGTHKMMSSHGQEIENYPPDERKEIERSKTRIHGKCGDLVLFDDRGFHGPPQPSYSQRRIILVDYFRVKTFGFRQVTPMPVMTSDLGGLSEKQMRVLGAGAEYMVPPSEYTHTRFSKTAVYKIVGKIVEYAYLMPHIRRKLSQFRNSLLGRS